ncbi:MAG: FUSC family protein, partial [Desulfobacterales bacterium]
MISLSTRAKNAIKPALGVVIAYGISLGMGWENPYWAGFAVAMISLSTSGQSLNKGTMRMLGTLVAAAAALTFIAWFPQDRWWFISVLS